MPRFISVTGGKGGTGKTVVALNLAVALAKQGHDVTLADCDVDCPNSYIIADTKLKNERVVTSFLPVFDEKKCTACGKCIDVCRVNALYLVKGKVELNDKMCTGCEACKLACPQGAVTGRQKVIGHTYETEGYGVDFVVGKLLPSEPISAKVVNETKKRAAEKKSDFLIIDTAAGIHCDVVDALRGSETAFAVTEPTPFGVHDLKLIRKLLDKLKIKSEIIVNRSDITKQKVKDVLLEIPYERNMVECYANNVPMVVKYPKHDISMKFFDLAEKVSGG